MNPIIAITSQFSSDGEESDTHLGVRRKYVEVLTKFGMTPIIIPVGVKSEPLNLLLQKVDGILIPGGSDVDPKFYNESPHEKLGKVIPERDALEIETAVWAFKNKKPLLAICRGIQVANVALGGTLFQDIPSQCGVGEIHSAKDDEAGEGWFKLQHKVTIRKGTYLSEAYNSEQIEVNSLHHQVVKQIAPGLIISGVSSDDEIIEGIEAPRDDHPFFVGIQWHPEMIADKSDGLFNLFKLRCTL